MISGGMVYEAMLFVTGVCFISSKVNAVLFLECFHKTNAKRNMALSLGLVVSNL